MNELLLMAERLALVIVLALLGLFVVRFASRRMNALVDSSLQVSAERRQQLGTLVRLFHWLAQILIVTIALMTLLSGFVDITPLLTSVGVAGLAVSLGAQTLIQDLIAGLLIIVENQYAVGDVIQVGGVSGTVEQMTLRATYLRDVEGNLHIVPNGEARVVSNRTKEWSRAVVELGVAYEEDMGRVLALLQETAASFAAEPEWEGLLLEPPQVAGPLSLGDWAVTVRVMIKTLPGEQWRVGMELRRRLLSACDRAGVTLPYPRQEVYIAGSGEPN